MSDPKVELKTNNGPAVLNTIRENASGRYYDRIPEATLDNINTVGAAILANNGLENEFVDALINRIGLVLINSRMAWNPLAPMKKGALPMGLTIEEVYVDLINGQKYDPRDAENTLFKRSKPNVYSVFHQINSELMYTVTVTHDQLRKAFLSYGELESFITETINQLYNSATNDEFLQMKELIKYYNDNGYFQTVTTAAVIDRDTAEELMVQIKAMSDKFTIMSNKYNSAGVWNLTDKNDQYLLVTPEINARLDVSVLAKAFNMDKADFTGHVIVIDDFAGLETKGVQALLVDKNWMRVYDTLRTMKSQENGKGLYFNYFYHVWTVYSTSRFFNAVAFVSGTPTVTSLTVAPTSVTLSAGQSVQLTTTVARTNNATSKAKFTLSGATDKETYVTPMGKIVLGSQEEGPTITVTATSVVNSGQTGTCTVTVS